MTFKSFGSCVAAAGIAGALALGAGPAAAAWKPAGPINLMIAFAAGGGADTQARLIATELEKTKGWKIIPQNVTGKGGAVMARKLKTQPNDGLTIGIAVTETFGYNMLAVKKADYSADDFTFVTTTAGSQMGIVAKTSRGWKTIQDVIAAAKAGKTVKLGAMSAKLADIAYTIQQKYGVKFNTVVFRGGRKVLNAITRRRCRRRLGRRHPGQGSPRGRPRQPDVRRNDPAQDFSGRTDACRTRHSLRRGRQIPHRRSEGHSRGRPQRDRRRNRLGAQR